MREEILLNTKWHFHKGDLPVPRAVDYGAAYALAKTERMQSGPAAYAYFDVVNPFGGKGVEMRSEGWEYVDLPHDYMIDSTPDPRENRAHGYFHYENAWYRKHFTLTEEDKDKRLTLYFEGVTTHATVYLNGCLMKHNFCGYTPFEVDITDNAYFDRENVLAVYVSTDEFEGWWYQGGGITRNVWLCKTDRVFVARDGVFAKPVKVGDTEWRVDLETEVQNENYTKEASAITVRHRIADADGRVVAEVATELSVPAKQERTAVCSATVSDPRLWDIDSPNLYTVTTTLLSGETAFDETKTRIGFRTFRTDPNLGFFLNGRHVIINGVCAHADFGLTGLAVPGNILRHKVKLLKEMGANGYRCSHYPHPAATMDALDEGGFIVMDETRWFESTEEGREQLATLVKRDRNRPSVFFWSVGNEEPHHLTEVGRRINLSLCALVKQLDGTRPVMSAVSHDPVNATVYEAHDVIGINYNRDSYEKLHQKYPDKAIFASECCATGTTRGWYHPSSPENGAMFGYDDIVKDPLHARENTQRFFVEHPYIMGGYQWIAFEHRGETMWPRLCSQSGAIDLYLQKKDAFYQNQSLWTKKPMVHLLPHWNHRGLEGTPIAVWAYTNCPEVELFLNGRSLGVRQVPALHHAEWEVPFEAGELRVEARADGKIVATDCVVTSGKPEALKLTVDTAGEGNVGDIALVTCSCLDSDGRDVPDAEVTVHFACSEGARIVATGSDICDHTPVTVPTRRMRAGRITVALKREAADVPVTLWAEGENLRKTAVTL